MNHVELFAGCGGLCLGLTKAGFKLTLANELSPMAAETFAYNFFGEDLATHPEAAKRTRWISSSFGRDAMTKRLREDPRSYPENGLHSDLDPDGANLEGGLVVGNILALNRWLEEHPVALENLRNGFNGQGVDLVSGGPPCQSFSLAGLREKNNEKNSLPWAFAKFVDLVRPKSVILENVTGILRPFTEGGIKYHAWFEVAKTFAMIGYVPLTLHVNAKYAGVAQHRPRFILMAFREDVFEALRPGLNEAEEALFESSGQFFKTVRAGGATTHKDLAVWDLNTNDETTWSLYRSSFLAPLAVRHGDYVSVQEAIGDLEVETPHRPSSFVRNLNRTFNPLVARVKDTDLTNRMIDNQPRVRRRFRIYQVMAQPHVPQATRTMLSAFIAGKRDHISDEAWESLRNEEFLLETNDFARFQTKDAFEAYLREHLTKKQTQRALIGDDPAPAALSIPDDACHYKELRTLSAREMARIQSFPDGFKFRSKMTTGGSSRKFEVPIYTQIGNAVPVLLGAALGQAMKAMLVRLQENLLTEERKAG